MDVIVPQSGPRAQHRQRWPASSDVFNITSGLLCNMYLFIAKPKQNNFSVIVLILIADGNCLNRLSTEKTHGIAKHL